jgi:hypothetical protein
VILNICVIIAEKQLSHLTAAVPMALSIFFFFFVTQTATQHTTTIALLLTLVLAKPKEEKYILLMPNCKMHISGKETIPSEA